MKIFISWSGELSRQLGETFRSWLPGALQMVKPYFTPSDVEKGSRWNSEIAQELEASKIGLFCITIENLNSNWLMFEAGALSKNLDKSHVCPILFGVENQDLSGPISQFQTTPFEKDEIKKLLKTINQTVVEGKLEDDVLDSVFEMWWPKLEDQINQILKEYKGNKTKPLRTDRDIIEEVLELSRLSVKLKSGDNIHPAAVQEFVKIFLMVYKKVDDGLSHQKIFDDLKLMLKPINYFIDKARPTPGIDFTELRETVKSLSFIYDEEDDLPF